MGVAALNVVVDAGRSISFNSGADIMQSKLRKVRLKAIVLAASLLAAVPAQAATFNLPLSGTVLIAGLPFQQVETVQLSLWVDVALGPIMPDPFERPVDWWGRISSNNRREVHSP